MDDPLAGMLAEASKPGPERPASKRFGIVRGGVPDEWEESHLREDRNLTGLAGSLILWSSLILLATALLCLGQAAPDPWLIPPDGNSGPINARTALADLVRQYCPGNVIEREVDIGEGETEPGVVVFPNDPLRTIEILWKDPKAKSAPKNVRISGVRSRWRTVHSISLGTSLKDLEALNGRPFHLAGFEWDYSGTVYSWDGGFLEKDLRNIGLRLGPPPESGLTEEELSKVAGDYSISSRDATMQMINPRVYQVIWVFPDDRPRSFRRMPSR